MVVRLVGMESLGENCGEIGRTPGGLRNGISGPPSARPLAAGDGWTVSDVVCSAGPPDRPFEEQHSRTSIAIVVSGTFQYTSPAGRDLMTPGSFLLGNAGECFSCGHEHGAGDRCVSFSYAPEFFDPLADEVGGS